MHRRHFLGAAIGGLGAAAFPVPTGAVADSAGETLYNGIRLPSPWPPVIKELPAEPVTPPYLTSPPVVIPIDLGRQLFVDDFLIEQTTLTRTFHTPRPHPANPILRPGKDEWDHDAIYKPFALFDGGRWLLWYNGRRGSIEQIGLATHEGEDLGF